jgi:hypothetical protein
MQAEPAFAIRHPGSHLEPSDQHQLDTLMHAFYEVISFEEGSAPDWEAMAPLFSKHARITRVTPEGTDYMNLSDFRNMAEELIEAGAFTSFFEREVRRRTDRFGGVIHVASAYETRISPTAIDYVECGVNSLQLIREEGRWKIVSLCWDSNAPFNASMWEATMKGGGGHGSN